MSILAIDLGGTKINVGLIDPDLEIQHYKTYKSNTSSQSEAMTTVIDAISDYLDDASMASITSIALCLVGRVDSAKGIWLDIDPMRQDITDVRTMLERKFSKPVVVLNDVNAAAYAELRLGIGKTCDNFVYYNVGTGIAIGIVQNGALSLGANYDAGEIGHSVYRYHSNDQTFTSIEDVASGSGMARQVRIKRAIYPDTSLPSNDVVGFEDIAIAFEKGDRLAREVVDEAIAGMGTSFVNIARYLDPSYIILGGGVINNDMYFNQILNHLPKHGLRFLSQRIVKTQLDNKTIGMLGCAAYALDYERGAV